MATCLQLPMATSIPSSSSSSASSSIRRRFIATNCLTGSKARIPVPPLNPNDPFLSRLSSFAANTPPEVLYNRPTVPDSPPYLDLFDSPTLMATPAQVDTQLLKVRPFDYSIEHKLLAVISNDGWKAASYVERSTSYNEHRPRRPPPDLPSLLLHGRIVYIGMPLVPAVTELVCAELMYLQWMDPKEPIYIYINSTGTTRDDGETVGMETEGFAIYDSMMQLKNEIHTVAVGAAIGQACLLLAAGTKGRRFMMPHAKAMIQQPRVPSSGLMPASDVLIRAKEVITNRDTLVDLLAKHTGNEREKVATVMKRPFYMNCKKAKQFGVIDKILWRGQEKIMADAAAPEEWDKTAGIRVADPF